MVTKRGMHSFIDLSIFLHWQAQPLGHQEVVGSLSSTQDEILLLADNALKDDMDIRKEEEARLAIGKSLYNLTNYLEWNTSFPELISHVLLQLNIEFRMLI